MDSLVCRLPGRARAGRVGRRAVMPLVALALDGGGAPHIGYVDCTRGELKYARDEGLRWEVQTVDTIVETGGYTDLAPDGTGAPVISYFDGTGGDLRHARWTGSEWLINVEDSSGDVGAFGSLALDAAGRPHISYQDATYGHLKYAGECQGVAYVPFIPRGDR